MFDSFEDKNRGVVKPSRTPHNRQYHQRSTEGMLSHCDDTESVASSMRSDRFESSQRNRTSGDILAFRDNHMYDISNNRVRVGRRPIQPALADDGKQREFGNRCLPEVQNSERFENSQRNRTAGDIVGHRDDQQHPEETPRLHRAHIVPQHELDRQRERDDEEASDDDDTCSKASRMTQQSLKVGRARTDRPAAIAASESTTPFATSYTPAEEQKKPVRHANHHDHCDGLLTGGSMQRSNKPDRKPLWY